MWWLRERVVTIKYSLPNVISFYPVDKIELNDISPIQSAINNVKEQFTKLEINLEDMEETKTLKDDYIRLIQGTVDAGVNGGLPKYEVNHFWHNIIKIYL